MAYRIALLLALLLSAFSVKALYDPAPIYVLRNVQGEWKGTLTYIDYGAPHKEVTLPTRLYVALSAPDEITLSYVHDDGPGKTVYSYERLRFDIDGKAVTWNSKSDGQPDSRQGKIVSIEEKASAIVLLAEFNEGDMLARYRFEFSDSTLSMEKQEIRSGKPPLRRSRYQFLRGA
ncbi:hypothetical protein [Dyella koreensis]|uniref:DUF1579 domain-containing protein n=1 Tax=Dyella koreensis TaxID=311235 RepID=A0ABW8K8K7_9GAMM